MTGLKGAAGKPGLKGEPGDAIDSSALDAILKGGKGNNKLTGSKVGHLFILIYLPCFNDKCLLESANYVSS